MGRPKKKPIPEQPKLRVPRPTHEPVTLTLCGEEHEYREPQRQIDSDELHGMFLAVVSQMVTVPTCARMFQQQAQRIAEAEDVQAEINRMEQENHVLADNIGLAAGFRIAIRPLLRFVAAALNLSTRQKTFLDDNYQIDELATAFNVIGGLLARPTHGSRSATKPAPRTQTD